jgi:spectrin beta
LNSTDYGKDEDSVQSLFKKLEGVERDLCGFTGTVENLKKLSKGLMERHHFDSRNIAYKQSDIEHKFEDLQNMKEKRSQRLLESEKYHRFIMQADQVIEWIGDQTTVRVALINHLCWLCP